MLTVYRSAIEKICWDSIETDEPLMATRDKKSFTDTVSGVDGGTPSVMHPHGRIIALLLIKLKSRLRAVGMTEIKSKIAELVGNLCPQEFLDLIAGIRQMALSREARSATTELTSQRPKMKSSQTMCNFSKRWKLTVH
jgi:hypothetical protein